MTTATLKVSAGFGYVPADVTYAYYDITSYDDGSLYVGGPPPVTADWEDISDRVQGEHGFTCHRGAQSLDGTFFRPDAGEASVTLNNEDRNLDPDFNPIVKPGISVVFGVDVEGIGTYTIFTGTADDWPQDDGDGTWQSVPLVCSDAVTFLANTQFDTGLGIQTTSQRVTSILNRSGWPTSLRNIGVGRTVMPAVSQSFVTAWPALCEAAETEAGALFVDENNVVRFQGRNARIILATQKTPQAVFGDGGGAELPFIAPMVRAGGASLIFNDVTLVYNDEGDSVYSTNAPSQAEPWGLRSWNRNLPMQYRATADSYADYIAALYGYPQTRFLSITVAGAMDDRLWPVMFGLQLREMVTVKLTPRGGGDRVERNCWVVGIEHDAQADDWRTTFTLEDATWAANICRYDINSYDDDSVYAL